MLDGAQRTKADIGKLDDQRVLSLYEDHEQRTMAMVSQIILKKK